MTVLRVKEGFSFDHLGVPVTLRAGRLVASDHPWVVGHEHQFEPAENAASSTVGAVETAAAPPGTRRVLTRPKGDVVPPDVPVVGGPGNA